jgi:hypothetical protein
VLLKAMYQKIKKDVNFTQMRRGESKDYSKGFTLSSLDSESAFESRSINSYQPSNLNQQLKTTTMRKPSFEMSDPKRKNPKKYRGGYGYAQVNSWTSRDDVIKEENQENMNESLGNSGESSSNQPKNDIDNPKQSNLADIDPLSDNKNSSTPGTL